MRARAGGLARTDVPTCRIDERLGDVAERVRANGWEACIVVNDGRIVFGILRSKQLGDDAAKRVGDAMVSGPSTFRPHVLAVQMARYMHEHDLESSPVTRANGELIGILLRDDADKAAKQEHDREHAT